MIGKGAILAANTGSAGAFVAIAEVQMTGIPSPQGSLIEVVTLGMSGSVKDKIPGLMDGGDVEFDFLYEYDTWNTLDGLRNQKFLGDGTTEVQWKVTDPKGNAYAFKGILTKLDTSFEADKLVVAKGTIGVRSAVTITAAS